MGYHHPQGGMGGPPINWRDAIFPPAFEPVFGPERYKILYGGRGGAKSWNIARMLLVLGAETKLRILCCREVQNSIDESVHQLLADQIADLGLEDFYEIQKTQIVGKNGTLFRYAGLRTNVNSLKSKEALDWVWVEEAANVSAYTWSKLIPTMRKAGSKIIISFNPELDDDPTYKQFVLADPAAKEDFVRIKLNWRDNPWFPKELEKERLHLRETDRAAYMNVYEGECRAAVEGSIFVDQINQAVEDGRIMDVPHVRGQRVYTFWDLGFSDFTAIWFVQSIAGQFRLIDFWEGRRHDIPMVLEEMQKKPYLYGTVYLPHDAAHEIQVAAGRTIRDQVEEVYKDVEIVPQVSNKSISINAARSIFDRCLFDRAGTSDGVNHLRRYAYKVDPQTGRYSRLPDHNDHSHAADAFQAIGMVMEEPRGPESRNRYRNKKTPKSKSWVVS